MNTKRAIEAPHRAIRHLHEWAGNILFAHRVGVSRACMLLFFIALFTTGSLHEESLFSSMLLLLGLALAAVATVGRLWCALYISGYKDSELITTGPYSITRNPLYFFSLLGFLGVGLATETLTLGLSLAMLFMLGYPGVIRREENSLRQRFGPRFEAYCIVTPRLFPRFSALREPDSYAARPKLFRRTMVDVVWFVWCIGLIELVDALHRLHIVEPLVRLF